MQPPRGGELRVDLIVEAWTRRGTTRTRISPIDNYISDSPGDQPIVFHWKAFNPDAGFELVPDTAISLMAYELRDGDAIELRITNRQTQESVERELLVRPFGMRVGIADTLMFVKRLGVDEAALEEGVSAVNFSAAPGAKWGPEFLPRSGFGQFVRPGVGINILFLSWKDPAFNLETGRFVEGTDTNGLGVGLGLYGSLFGGVLNGTYGWNLQADKKRRYWAIGVSFIDLSAKISGLVAKKQ